MWPLYYLLTHNGQLHFHSILESASRCSSHPSRRDFESINTCETFHAEERIGPDTQSTSIETLSTISVDEHAAVSSKVITGPSGVRTSDRVSGRCHNTTQKCPGEVFD